MYICICMCVYIYIYIYTSFRGPGGTGGNRGPGVIGGNGGRTLSVWFKEGSATRAVVHGQLHLLVLGGSYAQKLKAIKSYKKAIKSY